VWLAGLGSRRLQLPLPVDFGSLLLLLLLLLKVLLLQAGVCCLL
jgi:hypothetical protein